MNGSKVVTNSEITALEATQPMARQPEEKSGPEKPPVSMRKAEANRQNALKSTGPRTSRGKALSRQNAIKHGLFLKSTTDFEALQEDPHEYEDLLAALWDQYQPVGRAEELEVDRIAQCWWRLQRASRYENAANLVARRDLGRSELNEQIESCEEWNKEEASVILELQNAKKMIEHTGEISEELIQKIFERMPGIERRLLAHDKDAQERIEESGMSRRSQTSNPQMRSKILAASITNAITFLEQLAKRRLANVVEAAIGQHAIPNSEALDRLLRYETTIERQLSRSYDRLERLQRRRSGEWIAPPLTERLTH